MAEATNDNNGNDQSQAAAQAGPTRGRLTATIAEERRKKLMEIARRKGISLNKLLEQMADSQELPDEVAVEPVEARLRMNSIRCEELNQTLLQFLDGLSANPSSEQQVAIDSLRDQIEETLQEERELRSELPGLPVEQIPQRTIVACERAKKITIPKDAPAGSGKSKGATKQGQDLSASKRQRRWI